MVGANLDWYLRPLKLVCAQLEVQYSVHADAITAALRIPIRDEGLGSQRYSLQLHKFFWCCSIPKVIRMNHERAIRLL